MVSDLAYDNNKSMCTIGRSKDFRPSFGALKNLGAFVPSGAPMLATTATVTLMMRNDIIEKLDMAGCCILTEPPNKPNISYDVVLMKTLEEVLSGIWLKTRLKLRGLWCTANPWTCVHLCTHTFYKLSKMLVTTHQVLNTLAKPTICNVPLLY